VFFVTWNYCKEVMRGKLVKFHSIGGTTVMYLLLLLIVNIFVIFWLMHTFSWVHDIAV